LNTYLSTRPTFGSPEPLFAASGLTIPLKITLSDIKLSAFIILVFSKQKGVTLVFRNDPLESLKVSSTFDSISFVRNYLQNEIEGQLRTLLMDEVPAIIHRLSLRLLVPEYRDNEDAELAREAEDSKQEDAPVDPFASPPQDPVDINGHILDANQIASLSLDSSTEVQSLFSRKNLLRLAALSDSSHTLSLFSPNLREVVYRAWAGPLERGEMAEFTSPYGYPLSRKHSHVASQSTGGALSDVGSQSTRHTGYSSFNGSALGRHTKPGRKRKHRVVNMRKPKHVDDSESVSGESSYSATHSSATSESGGGAPLSEPIIPEEREVELVTPPPSPKSHREHKHNPQTISADVTPSAARIIDATPRPPSKEKARQPLPAATTLFEAGPPSDGLISPAEATVPEFLGASTATIRPKPRRYFGSWQPPTGEAGPSRDAGTTLSGRFSPPAHLAAPFPYAESIPGGILEQAWMMKMAGEIARRVEAQKQADAGFWGGNEERQGTPPPAYTS
jgi:mitochondrial distribution and morphology protein 34